MVMVDSSIFVTQIWNNTNTARRKRTISKTTN